MAPLTLSTLHREHRRHAVIGLLSIAFIVPLMWMVMDRDPPFTRTGVIVAADPRNCDLPKSVPLSRAVPDHQAIRAGGCVEVIWSIEVKRNCPQAGVDNVSRHLRDATGVLRQIGSLRGVYGHLGDVPATGIRQFMALPSPLPIGRTVYIASACYACNPLQHLFWPICVDKPDIDFDIVE